MVNVLVDPQHAEMLQKIKNGEEAFKVALQANHANARILRNQQIENLFKKLGSATVGTQKFVDINDEIENLMHDNLFEHRRLEYSLSGNNKPNGYEESDRKVFYVPDCEMYDAPDQSESESDSTDSGFIEALTNTADDFEG